MHTDTTTTTTTTTPSFLVIGGNGKTGRRVASRLRAGGHRVRSASRSTAVPFDWTDAATWPAALAGADRVYVTYQPDLAVPGSAAVFERFAEVAAAQRVDRIVLLSGRNEQTAQACEDVLLGSGIETTIVRCSFFAQNFTEHFLVDAVVDGVIALPAGDVREPIVDADDIADVAVRALTTDGHAGRVHELTGPRLLSFHDVAATLSDVTGRDIAYVPVTPEQYVAGAIDAGVPAAEAEMLGELFAEIFDGRSESLADGVAEVLGRPAGDPADVFAAAAAAGVWGPPTG